MINNPESFPMTYYCGKEIAEYLIYKKHIPLLAIKRGFYYFTYDYKTQEAIKHLPLWLKILKIFRA